MKKITKLAFLFMLYYFNFSAQAYSQQSVVSAGGDFTGTGGSMSLSTGLTDFYYYEDVVAGSLQFGVQHAFFGITPGEVPDELDVPDTTLADGDIECFNALQTITTGGNGNIFRVEANAVAELIAGNSIRMLDGTTVMAGGYLHARITTTGNFCDPAGKSGTMAPLAGHDTGAHPDSSLPEEQLTDLTGKELLFRVYPNPTTGTFTLEMNYFAETALVSVEVYGLRGERVLREEVPGGQPHLFSLTDRQPGIYIIRVMGGDQIGVQRIIKR